MLLPRCTSRECRAALTLLAVLVLAGCAGGPRPAADRPETATGPDGEPVETRVVPPKALTLYEQAVASMAAGDTIDAELRLQEFLLQYPDYPGAHVNLAIIFAGRGDLRPLARRPP